MKTDKKAARNPEKEMADLIEIVHSTVHELRDMNAPGVTLDVAQVYPPHVTRRIHYVRDETERLAAAGFPVDRMRADKKAAGEGKAASGEAAALIETLHSAVCRLDEMDARGVTVHSVEIDPPYLTWRVYYMRDEPERAAAPALPVDHSRRRG